MPESRLGIAVKVQRYGGTSASRIRFNGPQERKICAKGVVSDRANTPKVFDKDRFLKQKPKNSVSFRGRRPKNLRE